MRLFVVAVLAASLLTVSACTNGGTGNSTAGEGAPAIVTPTPAPTTAPTPFGGKGQLVFRPGSVDRAPPDVKIPKQAGSGGVIISPALYGNYATRFYKGHTVAQTRSPMMIEAVDGSLVIVTKLPFCQATP